MESRLRGPWRSWKTKHIHHQTAVPIERCLQILNPAMNYFLGFFFVHLFMSLSFSEGLLLSLWLHYGSRSSRCGGCRHVALHWHSKSKTTTHTHTFYTADWTHSTPAGSLPTGWYTALPWTRKQLLIRPKVQKAFHYSAFDVINNVMWFLCLWDLGLKAEVQTTGGFLLVNHWNIYVP